MNNRGQSFGAFIVLILVLTMLLVGYHVFVKHELFPIRPKVSEPQPVEQVE